MEDLDLLDLSLFDDGPLLFVRKFFAFLWFWVWHFFLLKLLVEYLHVFLSILECLCSLELLDELWSDEAGVEVVTLLVGVPRHETL